MKHSQKMLLISIKPKFAEKIFSGVKKVELRRVRPKLLPGDVVAVYVSSPIKQLQGSFIVEKIIEKPVNELWGDVQFDAGITREEFDQYFLGADHGFGIYIDKYFSICSPVGLDELKKQISGFTPPQSYRYLSQTELFQLQPTF